MCSVTLLMKVFAKVKSRDFPGERIGPALSPEHLCIGA
jgi:hypothetical protein